MTLGNDPGEYPKGYARRGMIPAYITRGVIRAHQDYLVGIYDITSHQTTEDIMADFSAVDRGEYPEKALWKSNNEKLAFSAMTVYIIACVFSALWYYTFG